MQGPSVATIRSGWALGHHLLDGRADHAFLQTATAAVRCADHAGFGIGHEHRQAVGGEHAERHVLPGRHLAVGFDDGRLTVIPRRVVFAVRLVFRLLRAGHVESERLVDDE